MPPQGHEDPVEEAGQQAGYGADRDPRDPAAPPRPEEPQDRGGGSQRGAKHLLREGECGGCAELQRGAAARVVPLVDGPGPAGQRGGRHSEHMLPGEGATERAGRGCHPQHPQPASAGQRQGADARGRGAPQHELGPRFDPHHPAQGRHPQAHPPPARPPALHLWERGGGAAEREPRGGEPRDYQEPRRGAAARGPALRVRPAVTSVCGGRATQHPWPGAGGGHPGEQAAQGLRFHREQLPRHGHGVRSHMGRGAADNGIDAGLARFAWGLFRGAAGRRLSHVYYLRC
mmetsp:Transcript_734/g.2484  ORF Transcript_734/g.2484 Transcript_734/m.2484 type:complete len:288 (+) Transcript_734:1097-1960(+)